jgi:hypothetical protein
MPTWTTKPKREPDEEGGFGEFDDDFSKLLEHLQPDTIPTGWPRYRKGGSPRNWDVEGDYNFVDPSGFVQIGVYKDTPETPTNENSVFVPYPIRYSGRAIILAQICGEASPGNYISWTIGSIYNHGFYFNWESYNTQAWIKFFWLAFGPGAG